jgi:hypothetical protein
LAVLFLLAVIMGGRKTRSGALLGAAIIVILPCCSMTWPCSARSRRSFSHAGRCRHRHRKNDHAKAMAIPWSAPSRWPGFVLAAVITGWRLSIFRPDDFVRRVPAGRHRRASSAPCSPARWSVVPRSICTGATDKDAVMACGQHHVPMVQTCWW